VDAQIQRIRETDAQLVDVDRPVQLGDVIIADVKAIDPAGQHETVELEDYSYDVGSRALSEGLDEVIVGHVVGDTVEAGARRGPNEFIAYEVTIKQNRERVLADFTDEWVGENTDYETIDELRDGIITQLQKRRLVEAQLARRDATLAALAELVDAEIVPDALVSSELEHRLNDLGQRLEQRGLSFEYFLQISGQSADQLVEALRADALRAVRVDLALRGLVKAENLEATDEEIEQELVETAVSIEISPPALRESLRVNGRTAGFASEVAKMKASKWILEHASYVDEAGIEIDRALLDTDQSASVQTEPDNA
jgi:trigger factor